ncbi:hypothetical protein [Kitasatospora sp. NPDC088779]|uniref:hypothetical protein n=1 Tax=Kitasatospora sp. NPDC088779 TaxID=3154964 RepID=UPI003439E036
MADTEDTPPPPEPPQTVAPTHVLPEQPTPATLPDPADLRPAGPTRRWSWLLGGLTAGAGAAGLALSLVANLVNPAPTSAPTTAATGSGGPLSSAPTTAAAVPSGLPSSAPAAAPYTALVDSCALLRPETVERYIKGATCTAPERIEPVTMSLGSWTSKDAIAGVTVMLNPQAASIYQRMLTTNQKTDAGAKVTDNRTVPGLGDQATLRYISHSASFGQAELTVVQRNALVTVTYSASTQSGLELKAVPSDTAEAAAIACAKDALDTLTTS